MKRSHRRVCKTCHCMIISNLLRVCNLLVLSRAGFVSRFVSTAVQGPRSQLSNNRVVSSSYVMMFPQYHLHNKVVLCNCPTIFFMTDSHWLSGCVNGFSLPHLILLLSPIFALYLLFKKLEQVEQIDSDSLRIGFVPQLVYFLWQWVRHFLRQSHAVILSFSLISVLQACQQAE